MLVEASGYMLGPPFSTFDDTRYRFEWKGCSIQEYIATEKKVGVTISWCGQSAGKLHGQPLNDYTPDIPAIGGDDDRV